MQKKDWLTNLKDVLIAEKNADKLTEEGAECMMQFVLNAELKLKFRSNLFRVEKFFAKNAL